MALPGATDFTLGARHPACSAVGLIALESNLAIDADCSAGPVVVTALE